MDSPFLDVVTPSSEQLPRSCTCFLLSNPLDLFVAEESLQLMFLFGLSIVNLLCICTKVARNQFGFLISIILCYLPKT